MDKGIPRDIVVDSCKKYVYWLNTDMMNPTIERARFSGAEREVFVRTITTLSFNATHKLEPHSLAIDHQTRAIYWFEPYSTTQYNMVRCDLSTKKKTRGVYYEIERFPMIAHPPNTLTISKGFFYFVDFSTSRTEMYTFPIMMNDYSEYLHYHLYHYKMNVGVAVREYDIQKIQDCEEISIEITEDRTFCVFGNKRDKESRCECKPGYTGERCDVYVCNKYCLRGWCRVNNEGLPACRCYPGYTGERCQINSCNGYCLNGGKCSLNKARDPVCQCAGGYTGSRCDEDKSDGISCFKPGDINLTDLLGALQETENNSICFKTI